MGETCQIEESPRCPPSSHLASFWEETSLGGTPGASGGSVGVWGDGLCANTLKVFANVRIFSSFCEMVLTVHQVLYRHGSDPHRQEAT